MLICEGFVGAVVRALVSSLFPGLGIILVEFVVSLPSLPRSFGFTSIILKAMSTTHSSPCSVLLDKINLISLYHKPL